MHLSIFTVRSLQEVRVVVDDLDQALEAWRGTHGEAWTSFGRAEIQGELWSNDELRALLEEEAEYAHATGDRVPDGTRSKAILELNGQCKTVVTVSLVRGGPEIEDDSFYVAATSWLLRQLSPGLVTWNYQTITTIEEELSFLDELPGEPDLLPER